MTTNHNRGQILPEEVQAEIDELERTKWLDDLLLWGGGVLVIITALCGIVSLLVQS